MMNAGLRCGSVFSFSVDCGCGQMLISLIVNGNLLERIKLMANQYASFPRH